MPTPPTDRPPPLPARTLLLLPLAALLGAWFARRRHERAAREYRNAFARASRTGRRAPARPDEVEFFLYVPMEGDACHVATVAVGDGYDVELEPPPLGRGSWLCLLRQRLSRTSGEFEAAVERLEALSAQVGGELAGWGSTDE